MVYPSKSLYRCFSLLPLAVVLTASPALSQDSAPSAFVETFTSSESPWTFEPAENADKGWLTWQPLDVGSNKPGGWRFDTGGRISAYREWPVGTRPFVLDFEVDLSSGRSESWRKNGISVLLSSKPVYQMQTGDFGIAFTLMQSGVQAAVKVGPIEEFERRETKSEEGPRVVNETYVSNYVSPRGVLNRGGAGGHSASWPWPGQELRGQTLRLRMAREADHYIRFTLYHSAGDPSEPVWEGVWQLSNYQRLWDGSHVNLREIPLNYVNVLTTTNNAPGDTTPPQEIHKLKGLLSNMTGITSPGTLPEITHYVGEFAESAVIGLQGEGFQEGVVARLNGKNQPTKWLNAQEIQVALRGVVEDADHQLVVGNPDGGLSFFPLPLRTGAVVDAVIPAGLRRSGGEVITLRGRGFGPATTVSIGGNAAEVVERVSATELKIKTPPGAVGRAELTAANGQTPIKVEPIVAYAAHPYLLIKPEQVETFRARFNAPHMKHYRAMILRLADYSADPARLSPSKELDPVTRGRMLDYMDSHLDLAVSMVKSNDWWYANNPSNTVAVANSAIGLMALSHQQIRDDIPEIIQLTTKTIKDNFKAVEDDGGSAEGTLYWNYGFGAQIELGIALENTQGDDFGLLSTPGLKLGVDYAQVALAGDGNMFVFNNSQPWLTGTLPAALGASRFDQPFMRWLVDAIMERYSQEPRIVTEVVRATYTIPAFILRGDAPPVEEMPPLPTLLTLDTIQWGVMRSAPDAHKQGLVVGIKGLGGQKTHHLHDDQGNYVFHAHGREFFLDAGYNKHEAYQHSIPLPAKPDEDIKIKKLPGFNRSADTPLIHDWEDGDVRTITVDATRAYRPGNLQRAEKVQRVFVLVGEEAFILLDDVIPAEGMTVIAQYQAAKEPLLDEAAGQFRVERDGAQVTTHLFGPKVRDFEVDAYDISQGGWVYKHMDTDWHRISGRYDADPMKPLISVFLPTKDLTPAKAPKVAYKGDKIEVSLASGKKLTFEHREGNWMLAK